MSELTMKEEEIIEFLKQGLSNKEIALHSNTSMNTVKTHLKNIFRKMNVRNRTEAVLKAFRHQKTL